MPENATTGQPAFDKQKVHVIFVLGGPGTGKGTACDLICKNWDFAHLSAGDLLRSEQAREGSQYGALITKYIQEGEIVPLEITLGLLQNKMKECVAEGKPCFLIDGFPRKMDQAIAFQENVVEPKIVLYLDGPEEIMVKRLSGRGRSDDNEETIKKRLRVNKRDAQPVVEYYEKLNKVKKINCDNTPQAVHEIIMENIQPTIQEWFGQ